MSSATKAPTETEDLVDKICAAAEHTSPENLTTQDRKRVKDAFTLLIEPQKWADAPKYQKKVNYNEYLGKVKDAGNAQLVMVFILSIGAFTICTLKKRDRLQLLADIKLKRETWDTPVLKSLAQELWIEGHITTFSSEPGG